jgi:lipopolysaccharide biosynthesis glycosyltransferase
MRTNLQTPLFIATASTEGYLLPLRVMLVSLKAHLNPSYRPVLFLFNTRIGAEQLMTIAALVETHSIVPSPAATSMLPRSPRFIAETAFPLLLSNLLPESLERVLFLDPDMLVLDDIARIWETEISNSSVAAVVDQAIPLCSSIRGVKDRSNLGIPDTAPYFNAGVMLVNLKRWKRLNIPVRASEYFHRFSGQTDFLHQEALNAVLWDDWLPLDQRWNLVASLTGRAYGPYKRFSWGPPGIVHFAGRFKPWRMRIGGPFAALYDEFLARSGSEIRRNESMPDKMLSVYDRYLRNYFYSLERSLWNRRII